MKKKVCSLSLALLLCAALFVPQVAGAASIISRPAAIKAALAETSGAVVEFDLDSHRGRACYNVEIVQKNGRQYSLAIDMFSGEVLQKEREDSVSNPSLYLNAAYDYAAATAIAQKSVAGSMVDSFDMERSGQTLYYDFDLLDTRGVEYDVRVNAKTGKIERSREDSIANIGSVKIAPKEARALALKEAGSGTVLRTKLDDERSLHYEIKLVDNDKNLVEVKLNALTGAILEVDYDD